MARRTKEDAEKTREILLDAAEAVFLEKGVANTSLEDIARHVGLTRGAVYWHFENKQALFDAMHKRVSLPLEQDYNHVLSAENGFDALKEHCLYVLQHFTQDIRAKNVMTILLLKCEEIDPTQSNVKRMCHERDELVEQFAQIFMVAQEKGQMSNAFDPKIAAIALHAFMHGIFRDNLSYDSPPEISDGASQMLTIFFNGLKNS